MILKVADDFKGELFLKTLGCSVTKGRTLHVSNDQFYADDIQLSLQKGWLEYEGDFPLNDITDLEKYHVRNLTDAPLTVPGVVFEPKEIKILTKVQLQNMDVQNAISAGLIGIEGKMHNVNPAGTPAAAEARKERNIKKKSGKKKIVAKGKKKVKSPKTTKKDVKEPFRPEEPTTTMRAWDASKETTITKEESKNAQFPEDDKATITYEPDADILEDQINALEKEQAEKLKKMGKKSSKKTKKKSRTKKSKVVKSRKSISPVGRARPKSSPDGEPALDATSLPNESSIEFVDKKIEIERISQHPKLKARLNDIIDLEE
tara:strand:+ start:11694 stop:12647 length:954 start_codon:yes stop_codon:yes gene_type:complete